MSRQYSCTVFLTVLLFLLPSEAIYRCEGRLAKGKTKFDLMRLCGPTIATSLN